jgi:hypothetical protein
LNQILTDAARDQGYAVTKVMLSCGPIVEADEYQEFKGITTPMV